MTYSIDLRKRVVSFINDGGTHKDAARLFKVSTKTIYNWLQRPDLRPKVHGFRKRKLDKDALKRHVEEYPDALLRERAAHFGVHINAIWVALRAMNIREKKSADI